MKDFYFKTWLRIYIYNVTLVNCIRARFRGGKRIYANLILLLCFPYILMNWIMSEIYVLSISKIVVKRIKNKIISYILRINSLLPVYLKMKLHT